MPFGRNKSARIQPMQVAPTGRAKLAGSLGAVAAAAALAIIAPWEGKENDPYVDIVGVMTVCYGETRVEMRSYSDEECEDMLADAVGDFGGAVLKRNPNLIDHPYQLAAATSLSYNIGKSAYARSSAARRFAEGRLAEGCSAIKLWNRAGGRVVRGLVNRRQAEYELCMTDLDFTGPKASVGQPGEISGIPPLRFMDESLAVTIFANDVTQFCNIEVPEGSALLGCQFEYGGTNIVVVPNPCFFDLDTEWFARIACHEKAHVNGWEGDHPQ